MGKWVLVVLPGQARGRVQVIPVGAGEAADAAVGRIPSELGELVSG